MNNALIIVPTLGNRTEYLLLCLESLTSQTYAERITIVVITPIDKKIKLQSLRKKFPTVKFEYVNGSSSSVINFAANKYSSIPWMNWIGDDDILPPDSIQNALETIKQKKIINGGVFGGCTYIDKKGNTMATYMPSKFSHYFVGFIPAAIKLEGGLIRTSNFLEVGGLSGESDLCPDIEIVLKIRKVAKWEIVEDKVLSNFRIHEDSKTKEFRKQGLAEARILQSKYGTTLDKLIVLTLGTSIGRIKLIVFQIIERRNKN